jgi:hypothetical protein
MSEEEIEVLQTEVIALRMTVVALIVQLGITKKMARAIRQSAEGDHGATAVAASLRETAEFLENC